MDEDGYPTEDELEYIAKYPYQSGFKPLMAEIRKMWNYAECGYWTEKPDDIYEISTAGWSGNESIISALQENRMFWALCWVQSRRGGHYIFEVKDLK